MEIEMPLDSNLEMTNISCVFQGYLVSELLTFFTLIICGYTHDMLGIHWNSLKACNQP